MQHFERHFSLFKSNKWSWHSFTHTVTFDFRAALLGNLWPFQQLIRMMMSHDQQKYKIKKNDKDGDIHIDIDNHNDSDFVTMLTVCEEWRTSNKVIVDECDWQSYSNRDRCSSSRTSHPPIPRFPRMAFFPWIALQSYNNIKRHASHCLSNLSSVICVSCVSGGSNVNWKQSTQC